MRRFLIILTAIAAIAAMSAMAACGGDAGAPGSSASASASVEPAEPTGATAASGATTGTGETSAFAVEPDEPWIAAQPHRPHLALVRPDGSEAVDILDDLPYEQFHPDWSPDGMQLTFEHAPEGPDADVRDVWISDADGSNAEPLVTEYPPDLEGLFWSTPAWSLDGDSIAMVGYQGNAAMVLPTRSVLAVVDLATRELSVVSEVASADGNLHANPRWSNDGTAIVFALDHFRGDRYLGAAIAIVRHADAEWSEPELITEVGEYADHPDWHPTEDLIVFSTYDYAAFWETDEPSNLYTIRPDGSDRIQLTDFGAGEDRATQPTWTSDGRIIFTYVSGERDERQQIAFIGADGSGLLVIDGTEDLVYPRLRPTA
jgi:Tol biopolymer transport system component